MDRRGFLAVAARAGTVLLIGPAAGCGNSKADPTNPDPPADGLVFTSDVAGIHTHDFMIAMDALTTPGAPGVQGPTTITYGHKHLVRLTEDDLARIEAGETLNRPTSIVNGHLHNFKFSLTTGQALGGASPTDGGPSSDGDGGA